MSNDMSLTEAAGILDRPDFIELKLSRHLALIRVNGTAFTRHGWKALCDREGLPLIDRASGWTDLVAGGPSMVTEAGEAIIFRYCPDVIADTTDDLDVMAEGWSLDLYLDMVEHIVDLEGANWKTVSDPERRRTLAENGVYHILDEAADPDDELGPVEYPEGTPMALLSAVQSRALSLHSGEG